MFQQLLDRIASPAPTSAPAAADMRPASLQLLLEVARSDTSIDEIERDTIVQAILGKSGLSPADIAELMAESEAAVDKSISFHQHVRLVNEQLDYAQKTALLEQMWQVAYADGVLDPYEEAFIRQIADLLYLKHRDFMQTKLRVVDSQSRS